jgi:hypothetical protein
MTEKLKNKNLSQSVRNLLNNIGNEKIINLRICRTPLPSIYTLFLNVITLGQFKTKLAETSHDKLFHLFLEITISSGTYILEKNEIIMLKKSSRLPPKTETLQIGNTNETISSLLNNTLEKIGESQFYFYQALSTNCQKFINDILTSNGLSNSENKKFILQDTENLFNQDTRYRKLLNTVTDIASIKDNFVEKVKNFGNKLLHKKQKVLKLSNNKLPISAPFRNKERNPLRVGFSSFSI